MDRRTFLETTALAGFGTLASQTPFTERRPDGSQDEGQNRPNIVLIMADDMGFSDVGCYGGEIDTPNIDGLAEEGLRFTQFYNAARCCPTRASLLTGLYPHQAGVGHMRADIGHPSYRGHLNDRCVTLPEVLGAQGYQTFMSGKWHLGKAYEHWPNARGFDRYSGLLDGASDFFNPPPNRTIVRDNAPFAPHHKGLYQPESMLEPDFYMTDFITEEAVQFLADADEEAPFFLYLSYTAPHWPIQALEEEIQTYLDTYREGWDSIRHARYERQVAEGIIEDRWPLPDRDPDVPDWSSVDDPARWMRKMAAYAAMVDRMDQGIGQVLDQLQSMGVAENTLILFLSDNGAAATGLDRTPEEPPGTPESYLGYGRPWANVSDTPFRRYKSWIHEGGIATPLIAHWPFGIDEPSGLRHEVGHVMDLMPTCLEVAGLSEFVGAKGQEVIPFEGRSLTPAFEGDNLSSREMLGWSHTNNHAIREGRWKLVTPDGRKTWQLYDMYADRTETTDLSAEHPAQVRRLADRHRAWRDRIGVLTWPEYQRRRKQGGG